MLKPLAFALLMTSGTCAADPAAATVARLRDNSAVLWREPKNVAGRNLLYGSGGKQHEPHGPFTFVKEDTDGTNPKFVIRDSDNVKWKVKLGEEAQPETVASRFVWAMGYAVNEDYYLPVLQVKNMPRLKRGQEARHADGSFRSVRLKRNPKDEEKLGEWKWKANAFSGSRELNGLRVMMALINNWDLKDMNNVVLAAGGKGSPSSQKTYMVSDLGASFGTTGLSVSHKASKGNLKAYRKSNFISKVREESIDFNVPTRPALIYLFNPHEFFSRTQQRWIGKRIPREDVRWIGSLLALLTPQQIHDAFRSAGYSPEQVNAFSAVVTRRIAELKQL